MGVNSLPPVSFRVDIEHDVYKTQTSRSKAARVAALIFSILIFPIGLVTCSLRERRSRSVYEFPSIDFSGLGKSRLTVADRSTHAGYSVNFAIYRGIMGECSFFFKPVV